VNMEEIITTTKTEDEALEELARVLLMMARDLPEKGRDIKEIKSGKQQCEE